MTKPEIVNELRRLKDDGKLVPEVVVEAARDPENPLHDQFQWDDSVAAHKYRIWQARMLIANVTIVRDEKAERAIPVFVSLMSDRRQDGGGYRTLDDVLADPEQRKELLKTVLDELRAYERRYAAFNELTGVFRAVRKVRQQLHRKKIPA